jgi:hypothetical protein
MKMITQTIDPRHFDQRVRRIRAQGSAILTKWGLLPRFKRWRLTQDPDTGMIVLFGILNNRYIATHTSIPFSDYFDPRLLHDLSNELQVQVVSCNSDGLRYAFILDRGSLDKLPTHIDYPFPEGGRRSVRVVYSDQRLPGLANQQTMPVPPANGDMVDDQTKIRRGVEALLKVLDDIELKDNAASKLSAQSSPDVITIGEEEFKKQVAEHKVVWQKSHPHETVRD